MVLGQVVIGLQAPAHPPQNSHEATVASAQSLSTMPQPQSQYPSP